MFDIEKEIRDWKKALQRSEHLQDTDIAELESHLREEIAVQIDRGLDAETAFRAAVKKSAQADVLGTEFGKARSAAGRPPWHPARFLPPLAWNTAKIALRKMRKHKGQAALQIVGLTIGLTSFILIMLYVRYESNYDTLHAGADHIYRIAYEIKGEYSGSGAVTPAPLAPFLLERLPEVRTATRFTTSDPIMFTYKDRGVQGRGLFADERFFRVFSFPALKGDPDRLLVDLESIVISRTLAEKLFGRDDPLGQTLSCFLGDMRIAGVLEDIPENSHIRFDWILPLDQRFPADQRAAELGQWNMDMYYTFLVLDDRGSPRDFESKLAPVLRDQYLALAQSTGQEWWKIRAGIRYFLQPLKSIHLESHLNYELSPNGNIKTIRLFAAIAVFILLIACINAANLTTARASLRAKEIGVRKSIGAQRRQLIGQLLGESMFVAAASLAVSLGLVALVLPRFGRFADKPLSFPDLAAGPFPVLLPLAAIAAGLLSGVYPALRMSAFSPLSALRRSIRTPRVNLGMRNVMFLFQFGLTIILISAAFVVFNQMRFIKKRDLGYDRSNVVLIRAADAGFRRNLDAFKTALGQNPDILGITTASQMPANITGAGGRPIPDDQGREVRIHYYFMRADHNFTDFAKMEIVRGRSFSPAFSTDVQSAVLINETFVRHMGWTNPIGKRLALLSQDTENEIVGVVKDFHYRSLHAPIEPLVIACRPNSYFVLIRIRPDRIPAALDAVRKAFYDDVMQVFSI